MFGWAIVPGTPVSHNLVWTENSRSVNSHTTVLTNSPPKSDVMRESMGIRMLPAFPPSVMTGGRKDVTLDLSLAVRFSLLAILRRMDGQACLTYRLQNAHGQMGSTC
ncbi:hypothetical protein BLNAU_2542 [Blattamonas nauphoetae]|uniref:Uncharacterized protein n=1 Tax=Blattamonas nauphoetae TaxID=2049346 RepID=A0ABQ9XZH6_9EUKA|nr:hypothetical protein BLNAU_23024 [Blattamonas nauphoetae]KAK2947136.1 hypothetical protein BLNAU_17912 [Blattamonas nauphoetae]KAK2951560.1 hypothetical protein BLNAU_13444 [Blattamonas nauphoetae]KAK2954886.1 hypothetical protein BLNAU_10216 [Blattamonas nauphoetae]KAK2956886.1 hypothetical protein BLNAU_8163 [Blattamonas nauphoetae]